MAGRTLALAQADYDAVHAAWLKALESEEYSMAGRSNKRSKSDILYDQMMKLDAEIKKLSNNSTGGIRIFSGVPTDL